MLRPDIVAEIRQIDAQTPASGQSLRTGTGYSAFTAKGLNVEDQDRLTAMALLPYHGIDVRFPLRPCEPQARFLDAPLLSHSLKESPVVCTSGPSPPSHARRGLEPSPNRGTDRSKENQLAARSAALRRTYLAENLQPAARRHRPCRGRNGWSTSQ